MRKHVKQHIQDIALLLLPDREGLVGDDDAGRSTDAGGGSKRSLDNLDCRTSCSRSSRDCHDPGLEDELAHARDRSWPDSGSSWDPAWRPKTPVSESEEPEAMSISGTKLWSQLLPGLPQYAQSAEPYDYFRDETLEPLVRRFGETQQQQQQQEQEELLNAEPVEPVQPLYRQLRDRDQVKDRESRFGSLKDSTFLPLSVINEKITIDSVRTARSGQTLPFGGALETVCRDSKKTFAVLVLVGEPQVMLDLVDEGLVDDDLPLSRQGRMDMGDFNNLRSTCSTKTFRSFAAWGGDHLVDSSLDTQWLVLAPVFDASGQDYVLDPNCPLSVDTMAPGARIGLFSQVYHAQVHPAHQQGFKEVRTGPWPITRCTICAEWKAYEGRTETRSCHQGVLGRRQHVFCQ